VNVLSQQSAGRQDAPPLQKTRLCHLGQEQCQEEYQLEYYYKFKEMLPKPRVVKVNELRLCQVCLKHQTNQKCYLKARVQDVLPHLTSLGPDHGLPVPGAGGPQILSPPPTTGTQMFQLRQRVLRKVDTSIAFKGGSNRKVVTKDYTRRMCLKKIRSIYPVNGFDTPELRMGDLYEMLL
jgi:hypothetical protein